MGDKVSGIKVSHPNGYSGILYGESSMVIFDKDGHEVMHTGFRTPQTEEELYELLEGMPKFVEVMADIVLEDDDDSNI